MGSVATRYYATRAKSTANASPYANLSALKTGGTPIKKSGPIISTSTPTPAPKPPASRPSVSPANATAQPEKAASVAPIERTASATIAPKRAEAPRASRAAPKPRTPLDPTSKEYRKEYNSLTRRWTAGLIAMPILLVTSYYLFDRLILGHEKKVLHPVDGPKDTDVEVPAKTV